MILVFSYGSNILSNRIKTRCSSYQKLDTGSISGYKLKFWKRSKDNSSKATPIYTGKEEDVIWGVVGQISDLDKPHLDKCEGLGMGYNQTIMNVKISPHRIVKAVSYIADKSYINKSLQPYGWYVDLIKRGAIENDLPADYLKENINQVSCQLDKNPTRRRKMLKI